MMEGPSAEEKHEPVSDIHTVAVDSLIALDPSRPIREADIAADKPQRPLFDPKHAVGCTADALALLRADETEQRTGSPFLAVIAFRPPSA